MRKLDCLLLAVEIFVAALMSLAATYSLVGVTPLSLIPFAALLLLGILTVVLLPVGGVLFGIGSVLAILPMLMKLNTVKWWFFSPERLDFCPALGVPAAMAIGLLVISGGLLLGYLQPLRRELRAGAKDGDGEGCRGYVLNQLVTTSAGILASAVIAAAVAAVAGVVQGGLTGWLGQMPWALPVAGLVLFMALGMIVFWIGALKRKT